MKAQSAMEFIFLASLMLLVILGISVIMSSKVLEAREEANKRIAEDIANFAYREIEMAKTLNDGYKRFFEMPQTINNVAYEIKVMENKELIVNYLGYEHIKFLPTDVSGNVAIGKNEISKNNGIVYINEAYFEFSDGDDNFVFKLNEPTKIQEARDILSGKIDDKVHVSGKIVKESANYNTPWHYHLDSFTIEFFESAPNVCNADIQYVEDHLDEACESFLPDCEWCPWQSTLKGEIS